MRSVDASADVAFVKDRPSQILPTASRVAWSWQRGVGAVLLFGLCAETIFSVPYRSVYLARHSAPFAFAAAFLACAATLAAFWYRAPLLGALTGALDAGAALSDRAWLISCVILGLLLRLGWTAVFHVRLKSDGLAYYAAARQLAEQHHITGAFWPPGFPFLLAPFFAVLGSSPAVVLLVSLLLFAATCIVTYVLAGRLAGAAAGRFAALLVALWPCHLTLAGVNSKETLLALLIPLAMFVCLRANEGSGDFRGGWLVAAGVVIGVAALTQPAFLLFPLVTLAFDLLQGRALSVSAARMGLVVGVMLLTVLPWTIRNYRQYHRVVLVSTNGGSVFYRANNPKANASYAAEGEEVLPADEFKADAEGYRAARAWIVSHPLDFAVLMVRKQVVYLGDDGIGVYESMKRDRHPSGAVYALAKAVSNGVWMAAWILVFCGAPLLLRQPEGLVWLGVCLLPQVYQWAIDSVFESGSRHHLGYVPLVAALVAIVLRTAQTAAATRASGEAVAADQDLRLPISA